MLRVCHKHSTPCPALFYSLLISDISPPELFVYDRFKSFQRLVSRNFPAIDKKGRSPSKAKLGTLIQVRLHKSFIFPARQATIKRVDVETDLFGIALQIVGAALR